MSLDPHFRKQAAFALTVALIICAQTVLRANETDTTAASPLWSARSGTVVDAQERVFQSAGATLSRTLYVPKIDGRIPAVIVLHAASCPTRDNPLYAHLAEMLPPLGIAVFVFDRRGSGKSGGKLEDSDYVRLADDGISAQRMLAQDHTPHS